MTGCDDVREKYRAEVVVKSLLCTRRVKTMLLNKVSFFMFAVIHRHVSIDLVNERLFVVLVTQFHFLNKQFDGCVTS